MSQVTCLLFLAFYLAQICYITRAQGNSEDDNPPDAILTVANPTLTGNLQVYMSFTMLNSNHFNRKTLATFSFENNQAT